MRDWIGETLGGPMARILISLYQVLRPIGRVFQVGFPPLYSSLIDYFSAMSSTSSRSMRCLWDASTPSPRTCSSSALRAL